jgi:DNA recombination-dependent growth factor C
MMDGNINDALDTSIDRDSTMAPTSKKKALPVPVIKKKPTKEDYEEEEAREKAKKKETKRLKEVFDNDGAVASLLRRCEEIKSRKVPKLSLWYAGSLYDKGSKTTQEDSILME